MGVIRRVAAAALAGMVTACGSVGEPMNEPAAVAPAAELLTFTTADNIELSGLLFGSGETAVVLGHMRGSKKEAWTDVAVSLGNNGIMALAFDFRGYAGQAGKKDTRLVQDMTAAVEAVREKGASKVIVGGASMGATAAVAVAAELDVDGLLAVSPPARFKSIDAAAVADQVDEPAIFLAAQDDQPYATEAGVLAEAAGGRFISYGGSAHGTDLFTQLGAAPTAVVIRFAKNPQAEAEAGG